MPTESKVAGSVLLMCITSIICIPGKVLRLPIKSYGTDNKDGDVLDLETMTLITKKKGTIKLRRRRTLIKCTKQKVQKEELQEEIFRHVQKYGALHKGPQSSSTELTSPIPVASRGPLPCPTTEPTSPGPVDIWGNGFFTYFVFIISFSCDIATIMRVATSCEWVKRRIALVPVEVHPRGQKPLPGLTTQSPDLRPVTCGVMDFTMLAISLCDIAANKSE
ncbi:hypothetical protein TNIN_200231 [Trichonephila inaurata madagascariensis]|uniref:Uncharacterized protein n=1 Tax=Trichonephila inaurata madagascariensis TaxID=2747483 RepID=A0A8X6IUT2_9ARAC|nr:hypothetical protein TNIN_200231 [Trichonephila inaurata madagascariensis]